METTITNTVATEPIFILTAQEKMDKLHEIANIIAMNKNNDSITTDYLKHYVYGALSIVDECEEAWCDSCPIRQQLNGTLCCDWLIDVLV